MLQLPFLCDVHVMFLIKKLSILMIRVFRPSNTDVIWSISPRVRDTDTITAMYAVIDAPRADAPARIKNSIIRSSMSLVNPFNFLKCPQTAEAQ